ncbi:ceramidase domain-containing protein [Methylopila turkensis]|uniref:Membrane protein n=1 Tax=Methylopila turkensis TaxID=1437816 RepID=A0A9W6JQV5_9HYPH|nr:ceramidase domain-containing protein [Methylopila turkensis]GLK80778.1 membrane protein [Methylopila turkensis]
MDLWAPVLGVYCERQDASFWAEPVNAVTNLAFVIAGVVAFRRSGNDRAAAALALIVIAIGVGSFLFHTFATRWALIADVAPIQLFVAAYFGLAMRRFLGLSRGGAIVATALFLAAAAGLGAALAQGPLRGAGGYAGGLAGLLGVAAACLIRARGGPPETEAARSRRTGYALLGAAALFAVSLGFRTIDGLACAYVPTGTHPVWHLLNAVTLFWLVETFRRARA